MTNMKSCFALCHQGNSNENNKRYTTHLLEWSNSGPLTTPNAEKD